MRTEVLAKEVMQKDVVTLAPESSLLEAWQLLSAHGISGAPVVSDNDTLVGVLSQTDVLHYILLDEELKRPHRSYYIGDTMWASDIFEDATEKLEAVQVADVMTPDVVTVAPDDTVATVAILMRKHGIHRVIVTNDARVVGIISTLGLLKILEEQ